MTEFTAAQAILARDRGQGRHIPETKAQALQAESGAAAGWTDFPGNVQGSDALIGRDRYWRAAYETQVCQLREMNYAAGRTEPADWVHLVSDTVLKHLRGEAAAVGNRKLAMLAGDALRGDDEAREQIVNDVLTPAYRARAEANRLPDPAKGEYLDGQTIRVCAACRPGSKARRHTCGLAGLQDALRIGGGR